MILLPRINFIRQRGNRIRQIRVCEIARVPPKFLIPYTLSTFTESFVKTITTDTLVFFRRRWRFIDELNSARGFNWNEPIGNWQNRILL